jgi:hypothetical protein
MMTTTGTTAPALIEVTMPLPFSECWDRLDGITVDGTMLRIDPADYFYRYENPTWLLCDWDKVRQNLLDAAESPDLALEQRVLDYVRAHSRQTSDPAEVALDGLLHRVPRAP